MDNNLKSFRIITIGDPSVGKTSILRRYIFNLFDESTMSTIGMNVSRQIITLKNGEKIKLEIVDTAGQERYKALGKNYYKNANVVLFVFALNNKESFENIDGWVNLFKENGNNSVNILKYLIGNKNDLINEIEVEEKDINNYIKNYNISDNKSVSAKKDNDDIKQLFQELGEKLYEKDKMNGDKKSKNIKLSSEINKKESHCLIKKCLM